ncbi:MAG TPA: MBL fold metallo-hydrolase [Devosiaceae bacterium]|jgi:L-ascorbate metabolism protein UlaG (beta-lactamase superfamily)
MPLAATATAAFAQSVAGDTLSTSAGDVTIHPVAHASLALLSGAHVIYVDPAKEDFSALPPPTGILITHAHGDHFDPDSLLKLAGKAPIVTTEEVMGKLPDALKAQATVLKNGDSGTIDGLPVTAVAAYNTSPDRAKYHPQGVGNGYVVSFGDKKIYIAGDTEDTPEMRALTGIEVAFLPMNLPYTMTPEQAADAVKAFRPKIVYPYHYKGTDTQKFKDLVGDVAEVRLLDWYKGAATG